MEKTTISSAMSVRPQGTIQLPGRIFIKFDVSVFFENLSRKFKFHYNMIRIVGTLHVDVCTVNENMSLNSS